MNKLLLVAIASALTLPQGAVAQSEFIYEGQLQEFGRPANGRFDLQLQAFDQERLGKAIDGTVTVPGVTIKDGAFRVQFDLDREVDQDVWLEVAVRSEGSASFSEIPGRSKAITGIGQCWSTVGDSGSNSEVNFLGTVDNEPLTIRTANVASLRIEPSSALFGALPVTTNMIAGSHVNYVQAGMHGAVIAGGGAPENSDPDTLEEGPNNVLANHSTVGGGSGNRAGSLIAGVGYATVAGGLGNFASGDRSTVGGGEQNRAVGTESTVAGGYNNYITETRSTIGGGANNTATGISGVIAGGLANTVMSQTSAVLGGYANAAIGDNSAVAGGIGNCAGGDSSFVAGQNARTRIGSGYPYLPSACGFGLGSNGDDGDKGTFMWGDSQDTTFTSTGINQFNVRSSGGFALNTTPANNTVEMTIAPSALNGSDVANLFLKERATDGILISAGQSTGNNAGFFIDHYNGTTQIRRMELSPSGAVLIRSNATGAATGVTMAANGGSFTSLSDRRLKTHIETIDTEQILARLIDLPVTTWSYIAQGDNIRHIGPMAQDFKAAFNVGESETGITTIDADGVALAAIQGLNKRLESENAQLRQRIEALEAILLPKQTEQ